jgi:hypothetical protein
MIDPTHLRLLISHTYAIPATLVCVVSLVLASRSSAYASRRRERAGLCLSVFLLFSIVVIAQAYLAYVDGLGAPSQARSEVVELIGALDASGSALVFVLLAAVICWVVYLVANSSPVKTAESSKPKAWKIVSLGVVVVVPFLATAIVASPKLLPGAELLSELTGRSVLGATSSASPLFGIALALCGILAVSYVVLHRVRERLLTDFFASGVVAIAILTGLASVQAFRSMEGFDPIPYRSLVMSIALALSVLLCMAYAGLCLVAIVWLRWETSLANPPS